MYCKVKYEFKYDEMIIFNSISDLHLYIFIECTLIFIQYIHSIFQFLFLTSIILLLANLLHFSSIYSRMTRFDYLH